MNLMRFPLWAVLLALLLVAGCRQTEPVVGGTQRPRNYLSIVSLSPSTTEIIAQYGHFGTLRGRTQSCNHPESAVENVPIVAGVKPNYEQIAKINPDLIIYDATLYNEQDIAQIQAVGEQTDTFAMQAQTLDGYIEELYDLGTKLGTESLISGYVDKIHAVRATTRAHVGDQGPTVAVIMSGAGGEHMIAGTRSFLADVMRHLGANPVGPDSQLFERLNAESLLVQNPEVLIVTGDFDAVARDPRLQSVAAIRNNRVADFRNQDVLLRRGSRVDTLIDALGRVLIPTQR
jgi:iron complex transport system substrate-binding protein